VDAGQGYPVGGDVEEFLGPDILGDPLSGDAGRFQLLEQAGGGLFTLIFEMVGPVDLVVVEDADFRAAEFTMVELVPDILNEIFFELVLGLKADDFRERAGATWIILEEFQLGGFRVFFPYEASGELLDLPGVAVDPLDFQVLSLR